MAQPNCLTQNYAVSFCGGKCADLRLAAMSTQASAEAMDFPSPWHGGSGPATQMNVPLTCAGR